MSLSNDETTLWLFDGPTLPAEAMAQLEAALTEALQGDRGTHLIGAQAFEGYVQTRRPSPPDCLRGATPCTSPAAMTFDALQLALLIEVKVRRSGEWMEAAYTLKDRRGQASTVAIARGSTPRQLALALVRDIYNATGVVEIVSTPPGARVTINGADIGHTPLKHRLPAGPHALVMSLSGHEPASATLEVSPNKESRHEQTLVASAATLTLDNAAPGAMAYIEGMAPQDAAQPLTLPAGKYVVELRAPGYESRRHEVELTPGGAVTRDGTMQRLNPLLRDVSREAILLNRYTLRFSYDHALRWASFRGARGGDEQVQEELIFRRHLPQGAEAALEPRRLISPNGLRVEASTWLTDHVGLTFFSLGYVSDTVSQLIEVDELRGGERKVATLESVRQLQVQPVRLSYRLFYKNLAPHADLGFGVNVQWLDVRLAPFPNAITLRQTEAFMALGLGTSYFVTPRWFIDARYNAHVHLNEAAGAEHMLSVGVGGAFPNVFGFEPEPPSKLKE